MYQTSGCTQQLQVDENSPTGTTSPSETVQAMSNVGTQANGSAVPLSYQSEAIWDYSLKLVSYFSFNDDANQMVPNSDATGSVKYYGAYSSDRRFGSGAALFSGAPSQNLFLEFPTASFKSNLLTNGAISVRADASFYHCCIHP